MKKLPAISASLATIAISMAAAANLSAQVFVGLERAIEERRVESAKAKEASEEAASARAEREAAAAERNRIAAERVAAEKRAAEDERVARREARLKFITDTLASADKEGKDLYSKFSKDVLKKLPKGTPKHVEKYLQAQVYYGTGQLFFARTSFKEFRDMGVPEETSDRLLDAAYDIVEDVRRAEPLVRYYQLEAISDFRLDYKDWATARLVKNKADSAVKAAKEGVTGIIKDTANKKGYVESAVESAASSLETWPSSIETEWSEIWKARSLMLRSPDDATMLYRFIELAAETDKALLNMEALALLKDFLATYPDRPEVLNGRVADMLATCYLRVYDYDSAVDVLRKARFYCNQGRNPKPILNAINSRLNDVEREQREFRAAFMGK